MVKNVRRELQQSSNELSHQLEKLDLKIVTKYVSSQTKNKQQNTHANWQSTAQYHRKKLLSFLNINNSGAG